MDHIWFITFVAIGTYLEDCPVNSEFFVVGISTSSKADIGHCKPSYSG